MYDWKILHIFLPLLFPFLILSGCYSYIPLLKDLPKQKLSQRETYTIKETMMYRRDHFRTLKGLVKVRLKNSTGTIRLKEAVIMKRPGFIRLELLGIMGQPTTYIVATDKVLKVYDLGEDLLLEGKSDLQSIYKFLGILMNPSGIIDILSGNLPLTDNGMSNISGYRSGEEKIINLYTDRELFEFRLKKDLMTSLVIRKDGVIQMEVRYDKFENINNYMIPLNINISIPEKDQYLEIGLKKVVINKIIADSTFEIGITEDTKTRSIYDVRN